jgi:hypothetical protein
MQMMIAVKNTAPNVGLIQALKKATNANNTVCSAYALYTVESVQKYIENRWGNAGCDLGACIYITHFFETCTKAISDGYVVIIKEIDENDALYDFITEWARNTNTIKILQEV